MDHHHLECLADGPFDGVYTMEQILKKALGEFFRVIKPGRGVRLSYTNTIIQISNALPKVFPKKLYESMEHN